MVVMLVTSPSNTLPENRLNGSSTSTRLCHCDRSPTDFRCARPSSWKKPEGTYDLLILYDYLGPSLHFLRATTIPITANSTPDEDFRELPSIQTIYPSHRHRHLGDGRSRRKRFRWSLAREGTSVVPQDLRCLTPGQAWR